MCRNQLLHRAACDRFSVADVTAPDEIPLLSHLSSIINSYLFEREHAQEYLDPLMAEDDGFRAVVDKLTGANLRMRARILLEGSVQDVFVVPGRNFNNECAMRQTTTRWLGDSHHPGH